MQLMYKGRKSPKVVLDGEEEVKFIPGEAKKVSPKLGAKLLANASDIFEKAGEAKKKEEPDPDKDVTPSPGVEKLGEPDPVDSSKPKKEKKKRKKPGPKPKKEE